MRTSIVVSTVAALITGLIVAAPSASAAEGDPDREEKINHVWFASQDFGPKGGFESYVGAQQVEPLTVQDSRLLVKASPPGTTGPYPQAELSFYADDFAPGRYGPEPRQADVVVESGSFVRCGGADEFTVHYWDPETKALHLTFSVKCSAEHWMFGEVVQDMPADELDIVGGILAPEQVRMPGRLVGQYLDNVGLGYANVGDRPSGIESFAVQGPARGDYRRTGARPGDCRDLDPGEACRGAVNTQVSAAGERSARLAADVRGSRRDLVTRLRQPGLPWHDYAFARVNDQDAQGRERVRDFRSGVRDGMTVSNLRNRSTWQDTITRIDAGRWRLYLEGPAGQPIEAGRYEIGPRDAGGPWLSSGPSNLTCSTGWFDVTELERDDDGRPERIAGDFDVTCEGGVRQRGSFGVSATADPVFPAWAPTVEASFSRTLVPEGRSTTLTVTVDSAPTVGLARVNLYAGGRKLIGTDARWINRNGKARFRFPWLAERVPAISQRSAVRVALSKNPFRPSTRVEVAPRPRLKLALTGARRGRETARVEVSKRTWDCISMPLQIRRGATWQTIDRQCLEPGRDRVARWIAPEPRPRTRTYRVRAIHPTPGDPALRTSWLRFRR